MWVFWLWLPLPILSIIIGHRSKNKNKKAKNNIISGYIIGILLGKRSTANLLLIQILTKQC